MLLISVIVQGLLLIEALVLSAMVTVRTRSIAKGALCLYGVSVLWVLLFAILVPHALPAVMEVDEREIAEVFPTQIGILPALVFSWIPAFVFASLVHLVGTVASDFGARPDMRASASRFKRSLCSLAVGLIQSLRRGLAPTRDRPYPKWVGVVLGLVLSGSAHFLSGRKRAGLLWYLSLLACGLLGAGLIVFPGSWAFLAALALWVCSIGLRLVMLVQSYRPVRRIGWHGWLALIIVTVCLNAAVKSTVRRVVHSFSIPTSTMAPTICGMRTEAIESSVRPRTGVLARYLWGRRYIRWETATSGILTGPHYRYEGSPLWGYKVGSDVKWLPRSAERHFELGRPVAAGDLLFSGYLVEGDHVMVEKLTYKFRQPKRGEIVVFRTDGIRDLAAGEFWIKRVVGLPGETVQIDPPHLLINGEKVTEPPIFARIASQEDGYGGFQLSKDPQRHTFLDTTESQVVLDADEYFVLGDNAANSHDSRYWGPVPRKNVIGRVTRICWPLDRVNALAGRW